MASHPHTVGGGLGGANVKSPAPSDIGMADALQLTWLSVPEILSEEIHAWVERERANRPGATHAMLIEVCARALSVTGRQLYRYMSGETPLPAEKVVVACRFTRSWRLLQLINREAGLLAEPVPDVGAMTGFDLVVEQSRNFREFSELTAAFAAAMDKPVAVDELRQIEREAGEAIQQIQKLVACYRAMADKAAAR